MEKVVEIVLPPELHRDTKAIASTARKKASFGDSKNLEIEVLRRSIDARGRYPVYRLRVRVSSGDPASQSPIHWKSQFKHVDNAPSVIIVGAGPAGYFAALELLEMGLKPLVFDRGKKVRSRRRDLRAIQQEGIVDPDSNYCFGEGGAGTFSDGKLYTRSKKRGHYQKVLEILVEHGAPNDILIDSHPHIGSNKLPQIVSAIRETILNFGGEIHFGHRLTDLLIENRKIRGVVVNDNTSVIADSVILATGHSARDIYRLLFEKGIQIDPKPFALGVRIEHPQSQIDQIQYKMADRGEFLPASSYSLACQVNSKGVFSFCMCPGGLVVPAATAPGEIVVNGMSLSKRNSPYANAGTVVSIEPSDFKNWKNDPFVCLNFQSEIEQKVFSFGDGSQAAPAQRLTDFCNGKLSFDLPSSSYIPGLLSRRVDEILPEGIAQSLRAAISQFEKQMKGYLTSEANVIATESRTSAPVKIPRDSQSMMHPQITGLFPCGEGAGFAGGIVSAAMDGQRVSSAVGKYYNAHS